MTSEQCIDIIKNRLTALVNSGQLKAKIKPSKSSISFYVTDIDMVERPLLTLRLSNHNPAYQNYIRSDLTPPSEGYNTNVSIEFYKPKYKASGRIARNRVRTKVEVPQDVKGVVPFFVNSYEYEPSLLVAADIDQIYNAILSWINGGYNAEYIDPFANTPKGAKVKSKIANITWDIAQNISIDNNGNYGSVNGWGADYVSENNKIKTNRRNMNKKLIRLTESDLHKIVKESVNRVLNEIGDTERGQYALGSLAKRKQQRGETFDNDYDGYNYNGAFNDSDIKQYARNRQNYAMNTDSTRQKMRNSFNRGFNG